MQESEDYPSRYHSLIATPAGVVGESLNLDDALLMAALFTQDRPAQTFTVWADVVKQPGSAFVVGEKR